VGGERLPDHLAQLAVEEVGDLLVLGGHDAVDAEVEVGLVELEEFAELGLERVEAGFGDGGGLACEHGYWSGAWGSVGSVGSDVGAASACRAGGGSPSRSPTMRRRLRSAWY